MISTDSIARARRLLAAHLPTAQTGDKTCAVCLLQNVAATSVYRAVSDAFTAWNILLLGTGESVCSRCAALLKDARLRTKNIATFADETQWQETKTADLWELLNTPPTTPCVLTRAESRKKHCWLFAGLSDAQALHIGHDEKTVTYRYGDHDACRNACLALYKLGVGKRAIIAGDYRAGYALIVGAATLEHHDANIAPHRASGLAELIVSAIPDSEKPTGANTQSTKENTMPIDPGDERAADYLHLFCQPSAMRRKQGMDFWNGFALHRLNRFCRLPLPDLTERLLSSYGVPTIESQRITEALQSFTPEETAVIETALRTRPRLCLNLAFERNAEVKTEREKRKQQVLTTGKMEV